MEDRPHRAEWEIITSGDTPRDSKGYPIPQAPGEKIQAACRFYPSKRTKEYKNEDQTISKEQGKIRFNHGSKLPVKGQLITVYEGINEMFTLTVKEVFKGSNSNPWVKV